jgi:Big-like domain-containing protein
MKQVFALLLLAGGFLVVTNCTMDKPLTTPEARIIPPESPPAPPPPPPPQPPPPPPPPPAGCLAQPGNTLTLTVDVHGPDPWIHSNLPGETPPYTKVDATRVRFLYPQSVNQPLEFGGAGVCWRGGEILGQFPPSTPYWDPGMHTKYAMLPGHYIGGNDIKVENVSIFDYGDGISFDQDGGPIDRWVIRDVHIKYGRDDCVENDAYWNGTIDSSFLDGCNTAVSARECEGTNCTPPPDGSGKVITIRNSLFSLQSMDVAYLEPNSNQVGPSHHGFWKWNLQRGPKVALSGNWFRVDGPYAGQNSSNQQDFLVLPEDRIDLTTCQNNVIVWLGPPSTDSNYPNDLKNLAARVPPSCIRIETAAEDGLTHWNTQVQAWKAAHTPTLPDVTPPIVSMFPPPQYWPSPTPTYTGTRTLVATAVDDRDVSSVRFQIDNKDIGTATPPADRGDGTTGPTKYNYSWNSRYYADGTFVANGPHTLRAIARDDLGQETPSAGVPVILSNPLVTTVTVAPATQTVYTGETVAYTATPKDQNGNVISGTTATWLSMNQSVATVAPTGALTATATANGVGTTTIRATVDAVNGDATLTVQTQPQLPPPTMCSASAPFWSDGMEVVRITWVNGDATASTEHQATFRFGWWPGWGGSFEPPGTTSYLQNVTGQSGTVWVRLRHVKAGYVASSYCEASHSVD